MEMKRQVGNLVVDDGIAVRGLIIRHPLSCRMILQGAKRV